MKRKALFVKRAKKSSYSVMVRRSSSEISAWKKEIENNRTMKVMVPQSIMLYMLVEGKMG